jgi:hypothetical protein
MNANTPIPDDRFPVYSRPWPSAPAGFAERVTANVLVAHRVQRRKIWLVRAGGLALAASVAVAVGLGWPDSPTVPEVAAIAPVPVVEIERTTPIQKPFTDAGEALTAISYKTTEKVLAPSRTLFQSAERLPMPVAVESNLALDAKGLADATEGAAAGLDPVSSQPRRAMNRLLRDFGIVPASKPRS